MTKPASHSFSILPYRRELAVEYAHRWAYGRNPAYYNYDAIGGDCTNFASQCLYAGAGVMNGTPTFGWYYWNANEKAPAWTGVPYFFNFITRGAVNPGPFGREVPIEEIQPGDFAQLSFDGVTFGHTPIIVATGKDPSIHNTLVAAHSNDADYFPLSSYPFHTIRFLHIEGVYPQ